MKDRREDKLARRTLLGGAATAGAAIGAATLMKGRAQPVPEAEKAKLAQAEQAEGYRLTDHIKRYYATARI